MAKKPKPVILPDEVWVMYLSMSNSAGSISHVSYGEKFWATKEECQHDIDTMPGWIGMGDRSKYRPMQLVNGKKA